MNKLVIIGISSTASDIYEFVCRHHLYDVIGFSVDKKYIKADQYMGKPVFELERLSQIIDKHKVYLFVAMQWNRLNADRRTVYERLKAEGYMFTNLISPNANLSSPIKGDNCWISDMACVDFRVYIGNNVYVKSGAWIGSGVTIEDHCFIGAHSSVGGGVSLGEQSFVGLGATIFDEVKVGKKCIVGATSALKRNISDYTRYSVSAENAICKQYREDEIESKLLFSKNIR